MRTTVTGLVLATWCVLAAACGDNGRTIDSRLFDRLVAMWRRVCRSGQRSAELRRVRKMRARPALSATARAHVRCRVRRGSSIAEARASIRNPTSTTAAPGRTARSRRVPACSAGEVCDGSGVCALACQPGMIACNGKCIDPDTDRGYCGATADCEAANAGTACTDGYVCNGAGTCELSCQAGLLACGGTCIDPHTDRAYCGAAGDCQGANAGTACDDGFVCNGAGTCELSCQAGLLACGGTCIDSRIRIRAYCGASDDCSGR